MSYTDHSESQLSLTKTRLLLSIPRPLNLGLITKLRTNWPARSWFRQDQSGCWKRCSCSCSGAYQFSGGAKLRFVISLVMSKKKDKAEDLHCGFCSFDSGAEK